MAKVNRNIIIFGGINGNTTLPVSDSGGATVQFYAGDRLESIRINGKQYGGGGGALKATAQLPVDGTFTLKKIQAASDGGSIAYFEATLGETPVAVGNPNDHGGGALDCNLTVRFSQISFAAFVDAIQFELVT